MAKSVRFLSIIAVATAVIVPAAKLTLTPESGLGRAVGPALTREFGPAVLHAQMRVEPLDTKQGHVALGMALRHISNTGIYMMATAHPDDENNGLLVMLNRGLGVRTTLATATRGNGGQNEIGPELFEPLGVLRTSELEALHRFDGAEQYFTRAVDFGYTIDLAETMEKWGRDEIIGDYVRLIRTIRPDVMSAQSPTAVGPGQHAHHAAAAILSHEAFKLAGDATKYPEQIQAGLRPWQPRKFYFAAGFGAVAPAEAAAQGGAQPARACRVAIDLYDPLLGKTYSEIGTEARSMHKCQGQAQLLSLPGGGAASSFQLAETTLAQPKADETSFFQDIDTTIGGLARFAGGKPPRELTDGLNAIATAAQNAHRRFDTESDDATVQPLLIGLGAVRALRGRLRTITLDDNARSELEYRLRQKEREFQQAIVIASGIRVEALADDGVVVPGQPVRVAMIVVNRGAADVQLKGVRLEGFDGDETCTLTAGTDAAAGGGRGGRGGRGAAAPPATPVTVLKKDQAASCRPSLTVPTDGRLTEPYWHRKDQEGRYTFDNGATFGLPQRMTPFYAQITFGFVGREDVIHGLPVQYRYEGDIFGGEKRSDLLVVPAYSVKVSPAVAGLPKPPAPPPPPPTPTTGRGATPPATGRGAAAPARGRGTTAPPAPASRGTAAPGRGTQAARGAPPPAPAPAPAPPPPPPSREIRVTVVNDLKGPSEAVVKLELPEGWTSVPPEATVKFGREDESQTVRFQVTPSANTTGSFQLRATVTAGGADYRRGFQVVEYPHIRRQHIYADANVSFKVMDVKTAPNLRVGYIMGTGDDVPEALEQLGVAVEMLGPDDLAWGNLSRFGTIVAGVRAYEHRDDLIENNSRLLDFVQNGGTFIVQYNRDPFNAAQYGPYPAVTTSDRITDENAPVTMLVPDDPVFSTPNKITEAAWQNWIQERGIYFLGQRDSRYRDLVEMTDPFENNSGAKRGALVDATYGRGRWVYVGLGLWREAAAGVDGAYPLLANLISLGH